MTIDGGTPADPGDGSLDGDPVDPELMTQFRVTVRAEDATRYPDTALTGYLASAIAAVDRRIGATIGIEVSTVRRWYVTVAAELFDRDKAPASNIPDRFGGDQAIAQQRSTRSPLQPIERELRLWVPTW